MADPHDIGAGQPHGVAPDTDDGFRVLVGWSHAPFSRGIQLKLQAKRVEGPSAGMVEGQRYLMTRNQALILAKYLLDTTGQSLPDRVREGPVRRALRRLTGG